MNAVADISSATPITGGVYLALRRQAAGVTIAEAASSYAHGCCDLPTAERLIEEAEADLVNLGEPGLRRLQGRFRFDALVYLALVQGDSPVPDICRGCGCTWDDACVDRDTDGYLRGCAWVDSARTLCSVCAKKAAAA